MYTTFKTWDEMVEHLKNADHPRCFQVNFLPNENEYAMWIGNQPYESYEQIIEEQQREISQLKGNNTPAVHEPSNAYSVEDEMDEEELDMIKRQLSRLKLRVERIEHRRRERS